ncbi:MAG: sugar phosphate permease [Spirochaetes bacterium RBG_13_51_14]|nr:MAG: sugar phosphate permease [Spirochaetes bacterium RBG_13_51_14]
MAQEAEYRIYGYRWIVLLVYFIITTIIQMQWLTFAPIAREARIVYDASALQIDILSMIFMAVFLIVCIPASYVIDTFGIRIGVGIGAALAGIFGMMKGIFASSYTMVVIAQIGLAVAQPFIINAVTKVVVHWFPINERATAVGLGTLAQFLGIIIVMIATPFMIIKTGDTYDLSGMLLTYGIISAIGALALIIFLKEYPPTPPGAEREEERFLTFDGIKHIFKHRDMILTIGLFFIGLGIFNALSTCIDQICEIKGLTIEQTGLVGGMMLIAGIIGAVVVPPFSDKFRKRKIFLVAALTLMTPGLIGMTIADGYAPMLVSSFVLGFFLLGAGAPIGFQYGAEVSYPAPESLSQGIILFAGQVSGILFILGMNKLGMIPFMVVFIVLAVINIIIASLLRESPLILDDPK